MSKNNLISWISLELSTPIFYFYTQDKCSPNDTYICKNAGVCKITKTGAASCTCNKEYAGAVCEVGKYILIQMLFVILVHYKLSRVNQWF